MADDIANTSVL